MLGGGHADYTNPGHPFGQPPEIWSTVPQSQVSVPVIHSGTQSSLQGYSQVPYSSYRDQIGYLGPQEIPSGHAQSLVQQSPSDYLAYIDPLNQPPPAQSDYRISGSQLEGDPPQGLAEGGNYYEADDGYIYWKRHGNEGR